MKMKIGPEIEMLIMGPLLLLRANFGHLSHFTLCSLRHFLLHTVSPKEFCLFCLTKLAPNSTGLLFRADQCTFWAQKRQSSAPV